MVHKTQRTEEEIDSITEAELVELSKEFEGVKMLSPYVRIFRKIKIFSETFLPHEMTGSSDVNNLAKSAKSSVGADDQMI